MAKELSNIAKTPLQLFINAGLDEIHSKVKSEKKGASAFMQVLLASDDGDTRSDWKVRVDAMHDADEKVKSAARLSFSEYIGANVFIEIADGRERRTQDHRNLMDRQLKRIIFALDVHNAGAREHVIIQGNVAFIKGGTPLCSLVWKHMRWAEKANIKDKRTELQDIPLVQRASDRGVGEISWAQFADVIATANNRKQNAPVIKPVTVNSSPVSVLQLVQSMTKRDNVEVHFSNVESRMLALETAEDVAAFAFEGDDMKEARTFYNKAMELAREVLQSKINAKVALQNGKNGKQVAA